MIRVLLVDDQELVREGLAMIVGAQPDMTVCGHLADGIAATRRLRAAAFERLAILVLTTFDLDEYVYEVTR